jgi:hypothetical protein
LAAAGKTMTAAAMANFPFDRIDRAQTSLEQLR